MMSKEQSTAMKGVAILMMLFYHLFNRAEINDLCTPTVMIGDVPLVVYLSRACYPVTFFLILSGYGFTFLYRQHRLSVKGQIKRLSNIYIHYWAVLFIFVTLAWRVKPGLYDYDIPHIIGNMTALRCNYNGETWFLFPYAMISLSSCWIIRWICLLRKRKHFAMAAAAYAAAFLLAKWMENNLSDRLFLNILQLQTIYFIILSFYFSLGVVLYIVTEKGMPLSGRHPLFYAAVITALLIVKCFFKITILDSLYAFLFILFFIQLKLPRWVNGALQQLGKHSMLMWMTHTFYCYYLFEDFIYGFKYPLMIFAVLVVISYLTSVIIGQALARMRAYI